MDTSLPKRLLNPLWRAKYYVDLRAGMEDPVKTARLAREQTAIAAAARVVAVAAPSASPGAVAVPTTPGLVWLATNTVSAVSLTSFTSRFSATYRRYRLVFDLSLGTANAALWLRLRAASADNSIANYMYHQTGVNTSGTSAVFAGGSAAQFVLFAAPGAGITLSDCAGSIDLIAPQLVRQTQLVSATEGHLTTPQYQSMTGGGTYAATTSFDGCTLLTSAGVMSGNVTLFAYRDT